MRVVFTGVGYDAFGIKHERIWWEMLATSNGHSAANAVDGRTQLLVSSRTDTVKAKAAADRGINVIDYEEYSRRSCAKDWKFNMSTWSNEESDTVVVEFFEEAPMKVSRVTPQDSENPDFGIF